MYGGDALLGQHEFESSLQEPHASFFFGPKSTARPVKSKDGVFDSRSREPDLKPRLVYCGSDALGQTVHPPAPEYPHCLCFPARRQSTTTATSRLQGLEESLAEIS